MPTPVPLLKTREHVRTPIPTRRRIRFTMTAALGFALLACADGAPTSPPASELAVPGNPAGLIVADPGVDYTDTWVSATQTVADTTRYTSTQSLIDPATGAQTYTLTVGDDPQTVQVLGGYGYDGQLRVTTGYNTANPIETASVRQVGDVTSDFSQNGDANYDALDQEPTATLGTLQYAQLSVSPSGGSTCADQGTCIAQMTRVAGGG